MELLLTLSKILWQIYTVSCVIAVSIFILIGFYNRAQKRNNTATDGQILPEKSVYIETINNTYMMYDAHTQSFICQATTVAELWARAKILFPTRALTSVVLENERG